MIFDDVIKYLQKYSHFCVFGRISLRKQCKNTKIMIILKIFEISSKIVLFRNIENCFVSNLNFHVHIPY